jgi:integrase
MKKLNALALPTLPAGIYPDALCPGLNLRVGAKRRVWFVRYRQGDKQMKPNIGYYIPNAPTGTDGCLTLGEARDKAREILTRVDAGAPVIEPPKVVHPTNALTMEKMLDKYEKARLKAGTKVKSLPEAMRVMRFNFDKYLQQPAKHFDRAKMRELRDEIDARAPIMANRFLGYCGPLFRWALDEEHIDVSPLDRVRKLVPEKKRERVLTEIEIRAVWQACGTFEAGDSGKAFARLVRFLLCTLQRKMEAANLKHGSLIDGFWKQAASENKSGRDHRIKLPDLAVAQIGKGAANALVFGSPSGGVIQNFDRLLKKLHEASGTADWSLHDLRRTGSTNMQNLGIARDTIDAVLNHSIQGVGSHYMHATMDKLKSDALKQWNKRLDSIINKTVAAAKH